MSSAAELLRERHFMVPEAAPAMAGETDLPLTVIERQPGWRLINLRELWRYRRSKVNGRQQRRGPRQPGSR